MNAQQLRNSILQEAIEGRLVPQDPNDEPASALLERIREEKRRLVKEGKLKKKDLVETPISEDEKPFEIPESWEWTRLGDHISITSGLAYKKDDLNVYSKEYVRVLRGGNISFGSWCIKGDDVMIGRQFVTDDLTLKKGMFISPAVTSLEHMGKTALIRKDHNNIVAGGFVLMFHPHYNKEIYWEFLNLLFQSGYYREKCKSITNKSGQAFYNLSRSKLLEVLIPLPPLAEQKRIVAKIEELMPKVEEYGKAQEALDRLNEKLPERFKKSILQEAIEGRLVPQDPNDEPASVLLDKIRKEKAQLVKEGKLKKKDLEETSISEDEIPFKIPESWEWTPLSMLIKMISGTSYSKNDVKKDGVRILRGGNIQNNELFLYDDDVFVPFELYDNEKNIAKYDIVIVASTGSKAVIGKPAFIRKTYENVQIGAFLRIIRPHLDLYASYLEMIFSSEYYRKHIRDKVKGTNINNIKSEYIEDLLIPFPPLAEQHRIVAKIEELMKEIDKMKM